MTESISARNEEALRYMRSKKEKGYWELREKRRQEFLRICELLAQAEVKSKAQSDEKRTPTLSSLPSPAALFLLRLADNAGSL